ncbi:ankyrin repeat domain-containing protein 27 [Colletotrichum spaethianum]|uniref:Ankyrin repeat domain-containing protein 27 n=1 Tax=Colletotrichum spaethianum TaxID=700344 RepID=A0AA37PC78_9PEZI|nr:ankyrin repeat domain-containing protein 27 [Colletotrichum spaethianum]GKT49526.1 ankyrin repeat domain-containing protein 27 [Colletotrichum spaethianum]
MQALETLANLMDMSRQVNARDDAGRSVLFHAACGGNPEIVSKLVDMGAILDVGDDYGRSPLHAAVMAGRTQAVKTLLLLGAAADNVTQVLGLTPLHFACLYRFADCVLELLKSSTSTRADMNRWTTGDWAFCQPVHLAVANGNLEAVSRLLEAGCETEGRCDGYLRLEIVEDGEGPVGRLYKLETPQTPLELALYLGQNEIGAELHRLKSKNNER